MADVLLVEDKDSLRVVLRRTFEARGLTVAEASDTYEARRLLGSTRFLVVVTDLRLPAGSGFEVLAAARESDAETPVMYPFPLAHEILKDPLNVRRGRLQLDSSRPGFGVEVDMSVVERYPWIPGPWTTFST